MAYLEFLWIESVIQKLSDRGLSTEDIEDIIRYPHSEDYSKITGRRVAFGYLSDGRYVMAVYELLDDVTIQPLTAYEVPEP